MAAVTSASYIARFYAAGAALSALLAIVIDIWILRALLIWITLSLAAVTSAYLLNNARIFRKRQDGSIPFYIRWLFIPFLLGAQLYNFYTRRRDSVPPIQAIDEHVYLARRLFPSDVEQLKAENITAVLDVTAEFDGLDWSLNNEAIDYLNIPVLDHATPSLRELNEAINWLNKHVQQGHNVVVHCALGRGRSVMVVAAFLLASGRQASLDKAMQKITDTRTTARLNSRQRSRLDNYLATGQLHIVKSAWLIVNPVSGGGKWQQHREQIMAELQPYFNLQVCETSPEQGAEALAEKALAQGADLLIACGGDGTLTAVASVLEASDKAVDAVKMAIIPLGTANSLSHALWGFKSKLVPIDVACDAILGGYTQCIDVARCNDEIMLMVTGIGFEQQMIEKADRQQKNKLGQLAYISALLEAFSQNQQLQLRVIFDDEAPVTITTNSFIVANAAPITTVLAQGKGMPTVDDGVLDVTWLKADAEGEQQIVSLAELLYSGLTEQGVDYAGEHRTAKHIEVSTEGRLKYVIDGETRAADQLVIDVIPRALEILIPDER
ncbi:diacylglycerol kinase family protein [Idiomarina xiamenensis]|uniref:Uncharacterized protein n=1 Tax=Idiomarina xiamenensis 10-D-4 TaxID=740709 RepID=K2L4H0_9GAMM|nr:diacylglycerol kinase family protein [Idiomarina xiamenensis]EKE84705.1 hypothetical protein A10D4_03805 [Idiomarina xiamenensis 10-D-4]